MSNTKDLLAANPYRNQTYNKSGWQNFLSALGFRTQADAWEENMAVQAAEYDAAILQKQHDEQYDSASEQVDRMRAAGLNPDLDPSSISAGSHASMGEDPSTPMQSTGAEGTLQEFGNAVMSAFTTALGLANGVQGVRKNHLNNRLLKYQVDSADTTSALGLANELFPLTIPDKPEGFFIDEENQVSWLDEALNRASLFTKDMNPKFRRKVMDNLTAFWNSAPKTKEAWQEWSAQVKNKKDFFSEASTFDSSDPTAMRSIYKRLGQAREKIYKLSLSSEEKGLKADIQEAENREDIAAGIDTGAASSAINDENRAKSADAQIRGILRGTISDILHDLDSAHDPISSVLMVLLSVLSFRYL